MEETVIPILLHGLTPSRWTAAIWFPVVQVAFYRTGRFGEQVTHKAQERNDASVAKSAAPTRWRQRRLY